MVLLESLELPLGTPASDFSLMGIDGQTYSLKSFKGSEVLVVIFMCNHCPYVQAIWGRLVDLAKKYSDNGVSFVGINPNFHPDYPLETMENMVKYAKKYKMNFPYLLDETQDVAKNYHALCTPDIYVFDKKRELTYHGRIDDSWSDETQVKKHELGLAISSALQGKVLNFDPHPSIGCSIKWRDE